MTTHDEAEDELPAGADGPQINPAELALHAVGRFPLTIVGLAVLGGALGLVFGFSQPNKYTSLGALLVRIGAREQQTYETAINPEWESARGGQDTADELLMLTDPHLIERVVERVGAARVLTPYDPMARDDEDTNLAIRKLHEFQKWLMGLKKSPLSDFDGTVTPEMFAGAVEVVTDGTSVNAQPRTNTLVVSSTADDPVLARDIASAYMRVLQERHREFFATQDEYTFVTERLSEARTDENEARDALNELRDEVGIYNLTERQQAVATETQALRAQNRQDLIQIETLSRQLAVLEAQLGEVPRDLAPTGTAVAGLEPADENAPSERTDVPRDSGSQDGEGALEAAPTPVTAPFTINTLLAQLQTASDQLTALELEYAPTSDHYQRESARLNGRIEDLEEQIAMLQIAAANGAVTAQPGVQPFVRAVNPVHVALETQRLTLTRQLEALRAGITAREAAVEENNAAMKALLVLEPTFTNLEATLAEATQQVQQLELAHSRSATLQLIDSNERMANLLISREPNIPTDKDGPERVKFLMMGLFGGLSLGMALALGRHLLDPSLRYPKDTERLLGVRVMGVIPEQRGWRRAGSRLLKTMETRA